MSIYSIEESHYVESRNRLDKIIKRRLDEEQRRDLARGVTDMEIKEAMFAINPQEGPWEVIGRDIIRAVHAFFEGAS